MEDLAPSSVLSIDDSSQSVAPGYPEDSEDIDDETPDTDEEKKIEKRMRLQSIFNRDSVADSETVADIDYKKFTTCDVCQKPIMELIVWSMNKPHHCYCLVCFVCRKSVAFIKFKITEGKLVMCLPDYYEVHQKCRICQRRVPSSSKLPYARLYHESCYKCVNCFTAMQLEEGVQLANDAYCRQCATSVCKKKNILASHYEALERRLDQESAESSFPLPRNHVIEEVSAELRKAMANLIE